MRASWSSFWDWAMPSMVKRMLSASYWSAAMRPARSSAWLVVRSVSWAERRWMDCVGGLDGLLELRPEGPCQCLGEVEGHVLPEVFSQFGDGGLEGLLHIGGHIRRGSIVQLLVEVLEVRQGLVYLGEANVGVGELVGEFLGDGLQAVVLGLVVPTVGLFETVVKLGDIGGAVVVAARGLQEMDPVLVEG